ncbi:hypothetical protein [Geodermatophilus nigrescens]|uniref:hypothetical protein n=1 Tax=Geodermatophilus nigrescens TaxID=1070870 RepID=UPI0009334E60|nr:hypothetical protein [Geodermatophilus nigrescens]
MADWPPALRQTTVVPVTRRPVLLLLTAVLLSGCADVATPDDEELPGAAPSSTSASATPSPTPASDDPAGCPVDGAAGVPDGAASRPTIDVDGDDRPDTAWIADAGDGEVRFGVATASGGGASAPFPSASPVTRSVLVADVTGEGELVALADDGRQVLLFALSGCEIVPVTDPEGAPYAFDLGFTGYGTGVGCVDVDGDGVRDLAGLDAADDGTGYTATAVRLDGPRASNTDVSITVSDAPPAQVEAARSVTCGDLSLLDDGVALPG